MLDMKEQEDLVPNSYAFSTAMMACSKAVSVITIFFGSMHSECFFKHSMRQR